MYKFYLFFFLFLFSSIAICQNYLFECGQPVLPEEEIPYSYYHDVVLIACDFDAQTTQLPTWFNRAMDKTVEYLNSAAFENFSYDQTILSNAGEAFQMPFDHILFQRENRL